MSVVLHAYVVECVVQYFTDYGPSFDLDIVPSYVRNLNTDDYVDSVVSTVLSMCLMLFCHSYSYKSYCWDIVWLVYCVDSNVATCPPWSSSNV